MLVVGVMSTDYRAHQIAGRLLPLEAMVMRGEPNVMPGLRCTRGAPIRMADIQAIVSLL